MKRSNNNYRHVISLVAIAIVISIIVAPAQAQLTSPVWRWLSGTSFKAFTNGICGAMGQFSSSYSPGSRYGTTAVAIDNTIYFFGGHGAPTTGTTGYLGDMWAFHQATLSSQGEWAFVGGISNSVGFTGVFASGPGAYPGSRTDSVMWSGNSTSLYVFGGRRSMTVAFDDLWLANLAGNGIVTSWEWIAGSSIVNSNAVFGVKGVSVGAYVDKSNYTTPGGIRSLALLAVSSDSETTLFGGVGFDASGSFDTLAATWRFNSSDRAWTWINGPSVILASSVGGTSGVFDSAYYPGARYGSAAMRMRLNLDGETNVERCFLFGGYGKSAIQFGSLADLWTYDVASNQWAYVAGESEQVTTYALGHYGSLSVFDQAVHPGGRKDTAGVADLNDNNLFHVFGGNGAGATIQIGDESDLFTFNVSSQLWAWTGGDSANRADGVYPPSVDTWYSPLYHPGCRRGHSFVALQSLGTLYVFGGVPSTGLFNDLWVTKGPTVASVPTTTPSPSPVPTPTAIPPPMVKTLHQMTWKWLNGASTLAAAKIGQCGAAGQYSNTYVPGGRRDTMIISSSPSTSGSVELYMTTGYGYPVGSTTQGTLGDCWAFRHSESQGLREWAWLGGRSSQIDFAGVYSGSGSAQPGARQSPVCWWCSSTSIVMFGGNGYDGTGNTGVSGVLSDLWRLDLQSMAWTYLKGPSIKDQAAVLGTKGTFSASTQPPAVYHHSYMPTTSGTKHLFFGGSGITSVGVIGGMADTWLYDCSVNQWSWVNGPGSSTAVSVGGPSGIISNAYHPGTRYGSTVMTSLHSNPYRYSYLFGGFGKAAGPGYGMCGDMWVYDTTLNQWAYVTGESYGVGGDTRAEFPLVSHVSSSSHPGGRWTAVGCADPNTQLIDMFGGMGYDSSGSGSTFLGDYWSFNVSSNQWAWAGGISTNGIEGSVFPPVVDAPPSASVDPGRRRSASIAMINNYIYVFGGQSDTNNYRSDLWMTSGPSMATNKQSHSPLSAPTPTRVPVPIPSSAPGIVVSALVVASAVVPIAVKNLFGQGQGQGKDHSEAFLLIDALQFVAISSQLSIHIPGAYRDFAAGFAWMLPVISTPFEWVSVPAPAPEPAPSSSSSSSFSSQRRLMNAATATSATTGQSPSAIASVFGSDLRQAALNYLPSLLFWTFIALFLMFIYILSVDKVVDLFRRRCLRGSRSAAGDDKTTTADGETVKLDSDVTHWHKTLGYFVRFLVITFYGLCQATFYALAYSIPVVGIFILGLICLAVFIIGTPLLWGFILYKVPLTEFKTLKFRTIFAALLSGYKHTPNRYMFSVAMLAQKMLTALLISIVDNGVVQVPLLLCVYVAMLLSYLWFRPHESPSMSRLTIIYFSVQVVDLVVLFIVSFIPRDDVVGVGIAIALLILNIVGALMLLLMALSSMGVGQVASRRWRALRRRGRGGGVDDDVEMRGGGSVVAL